MARQLVFEDLAFPLQPVDLALVHVGLADQTVLGAVGVRQFAALGSVSETEGNEILKGLNRGRSPAQ